MTAVVLMNVMAFFDILALHLSLRLFEMTLLLLTSGLLEFHSALFA